MVDFDKAEQQYTAENIELLSELEGVRKRPGMYIGSTNTMGLHHLVWEIVDNGVDEAVNGFGNKITVIIRKDGSVYREDSTSDNGHEEYRRSFFRHLPGQSET